MGCTDFWGFSIRFVYKNLLSWHLCWYLQFGSLKSPFQESSGCANFCYQRWKHQCSLWKEVVKHSESFKHVKTSFISEISINWFLLIWSLLIWPLLIWSLLIWSLLIWTLLIWSFLKWPVFNTTLFYMIPVNTILVNMSYVLMTDRVGLKRQ